MENLEQRLKEQHHHQKLTSNFKPSARAVNKDLLESKARKIYNNQQNLLPNASLSFLQLSNSPKNLDLPALILKLKIVQRKYWHVRRLHGLVVLNLYFPATAAPIAWSPTSIHNLRHKNILHEYTLPNNHKTWVAPHAATHLDIVNPNCTQYQQQLNGIKRRKVFPIFPGKNNGSRPLKKDFNIPGNTFAKTIYTFSCPVDQSFSHRHARHFHSQF